MKLLLACPTYGPVDPYAARSLRAAIMTASQHGVTWLGDASPDRMKFDVARNTVAQVACNSDADAVFWCDSDVILPTHAIAQLAGRSLDFITGIYFQRMPPHFPLIASFNEALKTFQWLMRWPEAVVAPIDGCGFGCVLTSTKLLREIGGDWFTYRKYSEDFDFCMKAKEKGFPPHVDTTILCGHLPDPVPVTHETYQAAHPDWFKGASEPPKEAPNGELR
jgi:hypothetical protein